MPKNSINTLMLYVKIFTRSKTSEAKLTAQKLSSMKKTSKLSGDSFVNNVLEKVKPGLLILRLLIDCAVKVLDCRSRGPLFKTTGWLQG